MTGGSINAAALAEAQRHYGGLNGWFWFFVAGIPLGVILPCVASIIAYKIWGDTVSAPVGLSALLWPIVGVAGALLLRGARGRARRSLELAKLADSVGLRFLRNPPLDRYEHLKTVSFMANPHTQQGANLLEGTPGGRPMQALDYEYAYLWGSVTEIGSMTLVMFPGGFERLPPFAVVPISTMGKLENFFLGKRGQIPFPHVPQFSTNFAVVGDHPPAVVACVNPLIQLFLADPLLTILVEQGRLIMFRRLTYVPARDYQAFLATAFRAEAVSFLVGWIVGLSERGIFWW